MNPRIEIEQLAQFIGAPPAERDSLLHWQRRAASERTHLVLASTMCCEALAQGFDRATFLEVAAARLARLADGDNRRVALDAIDAFARILSTTALWLEQRRAVATRIQVVWAPLFLGGVLVTGGPDMRLEQQIGDRTISTGYLSLHASPGFPLDPGSACRAARLLYELALANRDARHPVDPRLCAVIDVFSGVIASAATAEDRVLIEAANACSEVVTAWPSL